jgi:hypothetical protein
LNRNSFLTTLALCVICLFGQSSQELEKAGKRDSIDPAFFGIWNLNLSKSTFGKVSETFEPAGDSIQVSIGARSYQFKLDGKDYPTDVPGVTDSWKRVDEHTFEHVSKLNGKVVATSTWIASSDGKTFTVNRVATRPGDKSSTTTYTRTSGNNASNPLIGRWESPVEMSNVDTTLTIERSAEGIKVVGMEGTRKGTEFVANFDNRDEPVSNAAFVPNVTIALRLQDHRTYLETWKVNGKNVQVTTVALKPDGKTLQQTLKMTPSNDLFATLVYEKGIK